MRVELMRQSSPSPPTHTHTHKHVWNHMYIYKNFSRERARAHDLCVVCLPSAYALYSFLSGGNDKTQRAIQSS